MPRAAQTDGNAKELDDAYEHVGATLEKLDRQGKGCPDRIVGFRGANYLVEYKSEKGALRRSQRRWHWKWNGQKAVVRTVTEAMAVIGIRWPS